MLKGIAVGFLAYGLYSTADASIKALGATLPVFEILFFVMTVHCLTLLVAKPRHEQWLDIFRWRNPKLVTVRVICAVGGGICSVYAFTTLPLAEAYALIFLMPAFATMLSIPLLGEEVGWRRWLAVAVGFAGVLLVVKPGFRELHLGHLLAAFAAVFGAITVIVLRVLGPTEKRITLLSAIYIAAVVINGALLLPEFTPPQWHDLGLIALAGAVGGAGQVAMLAATRLAPANRVAPTQYSQIMWAVLFGALFFGEIPDGVALVGMALVGFSGLFTFFREEALHGWSRRPIPMRNRADEM